MSMTERMKDFSTFLHKLPWHSGQYEGFSYLGKNIFTVQFHPEASPGPQDTGFLFDRFIDMMKGA